MFSGSNTTYVSAYGIQHAAPAFGYGFVTGTLGAPYWQPVIATPRGALQTYDQNPLPNYLRIALTTTATSPIRRITALGNNADIDSTDVPEDIWPLGGAYPFLTGQAILEILSSSSDDNLTGIGAKSVLINGLDSSYNEISQTVSLSGVTAVTLPSQLLRINNALIMSAGTSEVNMGNVTVRDVATQTARAYIQSGVGITRQAVYTVPNGYTLVVNSMVFSINHGGATDAVDVVTHIRSNNGFFREPIVLGIDIRTSPYRHDGDPGITIAQKNDFTIRAVYTQNNNVNFTAGFLGVLVRNDFIS